MRAMRRSAERRKRGVAVPASDQADEVEDPVLARLAAALRAVDRLEVHRSANAGSWRSAWSRARAIPEVTTFEVSGVPTARR